MQQTIYAKSVTAKTLNGIEQSKENGCYERVDLDPNNLSKN
jgi:hypothetical protein